MYGGKGSRPARPCPHEMRRDCFFDRAGPAAGQAGPAAAAAGDEDSSLPGPAGRAQLGNGSVAIDPPEPGRS
jgi:hypothetical protein